MVSSIHLQLDHVDAAVEGFGVDDDLHVEGPLLDDPLNRRKTDPEVVGVEDVELLHRLEVLDVVFRNLGHFQKSQVVLKIKG